jgi:hypothetical protein
MPKTESSNPNTMRMAQNPTEQNCEPEVELVFDENQVISTWYHPTLAPILCALCGKNCVNKCVNVNPYCG